MRATRGVHDDCSHTHENERDLQMSPGLALRFARRLARERAVPWGARDLYEDLCADTLLQLIAEGSPLSRAAIEARMQRVRNLLALRVRAEHRMLQRFRVYAEAQLAETGSRHSQGTLRHENASPEPSKRRFADGSLMLAPTSKPCLADVAWLRVVQPDGTTLQGPEVIAWARIAFFKERSQRGRAQQASNVGRACAALTRDAQLLSVAALPWHEALVRLAASGIVLSRSALRSGLRAARLRSAGKTAHSCT
jgi:hypothetical protein